jgi:hypothetical protein
MPNGAFTGGNFAQLLSKYIGETVTIFTKSGGESGSGFTGVILSVNPCFVRLITRIGPPPGCALGNACTGFNVGDFRRRCDNKYDDRYGCGYDGYGGGGYDGFDGRRGPVGAVSAGGWDGVPVWTVGSVTDIPIDSIVSFVHNAV